MMTKPQYLQHLLENDPEQFLLVMSHVLAHDQGLPQPFDKCTCNCSGPGDTQNGYWTCDTSCKCAWVPLN